MKAVFFDLDGTLLDTARDFAYSINLLLAEKNKQPVNFDLFRKAVYGESKKMVSFAFNIDEKNPEFKFIQDEFLATYYDNCTKKTVYFPGMELLIDTLDAKKIPWGIVTNKPTWLTTPISKHFEFDKRAVCVISGDTLTKSKPHPAPLHFACEQAAILPENAVYIGDNESDIIAARAAGMKSVGVTFGYHPPQTDFSKWNADLIADKAEEILPWLRAMSVKLS
ncbi:MAG: HAD-IA family hydrolase [Gammaproteobacteria bacterium]|nr:HAD-IA family hydrolase [Gammaproteobacteria bacterium]